MVMSHYPERVQVLEHVFYRYVLMSLKCFRLLCPYLYFKEVSESAHALESTTVGLR